MMSELARELVDGLGYGGPGESSVVELDDERSVRLKLEPDYDTSVNDYDCYGTFEPVERMGYRNDFGYHRRPDNFDGNAEKLWLGRSDQVWWQPPADVKRTDPGFAEFRQAVIEVGEYGFMVVVVEVLEGADHYDRGIVRDSTCLGGVEGNADKDYLATIVEDMLGEVDIEVKV